MWQSNKHKFTTASLILVLSAAFVGLPRALYRLHSPGDHRSAANYSLAEASGKFLSVQGIGRNFADLSLRWDDGLPTMPQ